MNDDEWVEIIPEEDYYIKVLLEGCSITIGDLHITKIERRFKSPPDKVEVQVYKRNPSDEDEFIQMFHNYREAVQTFLTMKRKLKS